MASEDILQSLQNAARSRESAAMCSALALLDAACMEDAQECAIVLHFLSSFAHVAELANWNAEKLLAAPEKDENPVHGHTPFFLRVLVPR